MDFKLVIHYVGVNNPLIMLIHHIQYRTSCESAAFFCGTSSDNGTIYCWGSLSLSTVPKHIDVPVTSIAATQYGVCGVRANDSFIQCWGPMYAFTVPSIYAKSVTGDSFAICAILYDTTVRCWYDNHESGISTSLLPGSDYQKLKININYCGLFSNGSIYCSRFGWSPAGELFEDVFVAVNCGCGLTVGDRYLRCWGYNCPALNESLIAYITAPSASNYCLHYQNKTIMCTDTAPSNCSSMYSS